MPHPHAIAKAALAAVGLWFIAKILQAPNTLAMQHNMTPAVFLTAIALAAAAGLVSWYLFIVKNDALAGKLHPGPFTSTTIKADTAAVLDMTIAFLGIVLLASHIDDFILTGFNLYYIADYFLDSLVYDLPAEPFDWNTYELTALAAYTITALLAAYLLIGRHRLVNYLARQTDISFDKELPA